MCVCVCVCVCAVVFHVYDDMQQGVLTPRSFEHFALRGEEAVPRPFAAFFEEVRCCNHRERERASE